MPQLSPQADALLGQRVGDYDVIEAIAEGGMGVVYRGVHPVIKKQVAIKVLKPAPDADTTLLDQLIAEAEAVNSIGHQHIVDIFGLGSLPDGRPYIIMEYLSGEALDAYLYKHQGPLPVADAVEILIDICGPLLAAHNRRVIHRDLKPSNVFLCAQADGSRFLKLLDFGLAKKAAGLDGVTEQTARAFVSGTPDYIAPEQARGKAISPRTDLYALGCLAFELLTGKVPYVAKTPIDVMRAHVHDEVPRPSSRNPTVPRELDDLVYAMLAKDPEARPPSAEDVRAVLRKVLKQLKASQTAMPVVRDEPRPGVRASGEKKAQVDTQVVKRVGGRSPLLLGGLALAAVVVVGGGALLLAGGDEKPATGEPQAPPPGTVAKLPAPPAETVPSPPPPDTATPDTTPVPTPPDVPDTAAPQDTPAATGDAVAVDDLAPLPTGVRAKKARPEPRAPSTDALKTRLTGLEKRLRDKTPTGAVPDPSALQLLSRYRVQAAMASSNTERLAVARALDGWERVFLKR